jgi:N-acetyltransferase
MNVLEQNPALLGGPAELPAGLDLRTLEPADGTKVTAVIDKWWGRPMGALVPRPFFQHFCDTSFIVEADGELEAFLVGFLSQTEPDASYIHAAAVSPARRDQGIGRLLYQHFAVVVARHGRWRIRGVTARSNTPSLEFHRRLGFRCELPADALADDRVDLVLDLRPPTTVDLDDGGVGTVAAALRLPLVGELVALEPLTRDHAADLRAAATDSDWSWMPLDGSTPERFARWLDWVLANVESEPGAALAVIRRDTGRAIGSTSFHAIHPEHRRVEIGMTWYARSEWRSGANVEAKLLMLERAFALGFRRVEFKTDARNARSRGALMALPAQFEGVLRKHMLVRGGETRDSAYYSVIDDDWPAVRANLGRRLGR